MILTPQRSWNQTLLSAIYGLKLPSRKLRCAGFSAAFTPFCLLVIPHVHRAPSLSLDYQALRESVANARRSLPASRADVPSLSDDDSMDFDSDAARHRVQVLLDVCAAEFTEVHRSGCGWESVINDAKGRLAHAQVPACIATTISLPSPLCSAAAWETQHTSMCSLVSLRNFSFYVYYVLQTRCLYEILLRISTPAPAAGDVAIGVPQHRRIFGRQSARCTSVAVAH